MTVDSNPRVSPILRTLTWIEVAVVGAAAGLYTFPGLVIPFWPWSLTPFNATFIGATYFGAWVPLFILASVGRWNPGRVVLPMIGVFTVYILLVSLLVPGKFLWDRVGTYIWWPLYVILPVSSAVYLWLYRKWPAVSAGRPMAALRAMLLTQAVLAALYGTALFIAPVAATIWWPWPVDEFTGRVYGAPFLTLAVGSLLLIKNSSRQELMTLGATGLTFGLSAAVGLLKTDMGLGRVVWGAPGTVIWEALFLSIAVIGAVNILIGLAQRQRSVQPALAD